MPGYSKEQQVGDYKKRQEERRAIKAAKSKKATPTRKIKNVSTQNVSHGSNGQKYTTAQVNRRIDQAKRKKNQDSTGACENCDRNNSRITKSHIVSVKYARENGMTELCWDLNNIEDHCEGCHRDIESLSNQTRLDIYLNKIQGGPICR